MPGCVSAHSVKEEAKSLEWVTVEACRVHTTRNSQGITQKMEWVRCTLIDRSFRLGSHICQNLLPCSWGIYNAVCCLHDCVARPCCGAEDCPLLCCIA